MKQPYLIRVKAEGPFALAGLWDHWEGEGRQIDSFTIVVTNANDLTREIHDRMPVILTMADWKNWLDLGTPPDVLKELLVPYRAKDMTFWAVNRRVGSPAVNDSKLADPIEV